MITDYAQTTVKLHSLLVNDEAKTAIDNALSTYPLYQGKKQYDLIPTRDELNKRLLNYYKYREIGFETIGRFLDELKNTMCEIMPYYNELLKTVEIMADLENPFDNVDVMETFEETRTEKTETEGTSTGNQNTSSNGTATSTSEGEGTNTNTITGNGDATTDKTRKFSDTPQNRVDSIDNYLTDYTKENETKTENSTTKEDGSTTSKTESTDTSESTTNATETTTATGTSDVTGTTKNTYTKKGNQGVNTYAHDMIEFRTSIRDIVNEIITDHRIQNLFMLVW